MIFRYLLVLAFLVRMVAADTGETEWYVPPTVTDSFAGQEGHVVLLPNPDGIPSTGVYLGKTVEPNGETVYHVRDVTPQDFDPGGPIELSVGKPHIVDDGSQPPPGFNGGNSSSAPGGAAPDGNYRPGISLPQTSPLEQGLGAGLTAGVAAAALRGFYNAVVMPPSLEAELNQAGQALANADSGERQAMTNLRNAQNAAGEAARQGLAQAATILSRPVAPIPAPRAVDAPPVYATQDPAFTSQADPIRTRLRTGFVGDAQTTREVRGIGNAALTAASQAWSVGDQSLSKSELAIATNMADLLVGLDPVTGLARSAYEVYTGKNMITQERLATWQRVMAGAIFAGSLVTMGAASSVAGAVKAALGVLKEFKPAQFNAAVSAVMAAGKFAQELKGLGWTDREIVKFASFQRNILGSEIHDFDYAVDAFSSWSAKAKTTFPDMMAALKGSPETIATQAKELGVSTDTLLSRKAKAIGFYNNVERFSGNSESIANHLRGIDFSKDVAVKTIPNGTKMYQWSRTGDMAGQYFSWKVVKPTALGLGETLEINGRVVDRELRAYIVVGDTPSLQSTAAGIVDDFSWRGHPQATVGGAKQVYMDPELLERLREVKP